MKFAVILSGCGVNDGSEIHESVMTLLAIAKNGGTYSIFAPDIQQYHVIDHLSGDVTEETRNVLTESARIARGKIQALDKYKVDDFDALVLPGGLGAAKNLCTYAFEGVEFSVDMLVEKAVIETHKAGKPIGALCISPVLIARLIKNADLTAGSDKSTAADIEALGSVHIATGNGEIVIDTSNRIVSNPCYMLDASIVDIAEGAENVIKAIMDF